MSDDDWDDDYTSDDVEYDDDPYEDDDGDQAEEVVEEEDVNQTGYMEEIDNDNDSKAEGEDEDQERGTDGSMSNYEYAKPWGGTGGFMDSYGIKRTPEGHQEANEMVDTMREAAEKHGNLR